MIGDNSYKHRNRYLVGVIVFFVCVVTAIVGIFIRYNFKTLKYMFKEKPIELTQNENQVGKIILKMKNLEEFAFKYDKTNYQTYTLQYLGFTGNLGEGYNGFENEIKTSIFNDEFNSLKQENVIRSKNLGENIDLNKVAKSIAYFIEDKVNPVYNHPETWTLEQCQDYASWRGNLLNLIAEYSSYYKDQNGFIPVPEEDKENIIEQFFQRFNGEVNSSNEDLKYYFKESMDGANIARMIKRGDYGITIYNNVMKYYENVSQVSRINRFKLETFGFITDAKTLETEMRIRMGKTSDTLAFNESVFDLCVQAFAEYLVECG